MYKRQNRRRYIQEEYNKEHGIVPKTIKKKVHEIIAATEGVTKKKTDILDKDPESMSREELLAAIKKIEKSMKKAAADLDFEKAAELRDKMVEMKRISLL